MTESSDLTRSPDRPNLDDVLPVTEQAIPDHHAHGKTSAHPDDDVLAHRTEQERVAAGLEDFDPDDVPPAEA